MSIEKEKYLLNITDLEEKYESFISKPYINEELQKVIANSDVLIIPLVGFRDKDEPLFPIHTNEIFRFLKKSSVNVEVCIDDDKYYELALHSDLKRIGKFVVKEFALPVFIAVISTYITANYIEENENNNSKDEIKIEITVIDSLSSKRIDYEGPADKFEDAAETIKKNFWENK